MFQFGEEKNTSQLFKALSHGSVYNVGYSADWIQMLNPNNYHLPPFIPVLQLTFNISLPSMRASLGGVVPTDQQS
jgi:hypothetical protein